MATGLLINGLNMRKPSVLILGKRGGILQWYEGLLAARAQLTGVSIHGFALNHNNWSERASKKLLKLTRQSSELYTARLLARAIQRTRPDVILIADLFYLGPPLLEVLQQAKPRAKIYHWIGDFFDQRLASSTTVIDQFLFTDSSFLDDARQMGINQVAYLPLAFNPAVFYPPPVSLPRKAALLFIGAWSENRQALLQQLKVPVTVYGKGWDKLKSDYVSVHSYNLSLQQVAWLYQQYQYVLNIINRNNTRMGLNMRCFEAIAAGAILVTQYSNDLGKCFDVEKDLIYFSNAGELTDKLAEYPVSQAQASCAKVQAEHTYAQRLTTVIKKSLL